MEEWSLENVLQMLPELPIIYWKTIINKRFVCYTICLFNTCRI
jgi:hypothetical protein